MEINIGEIIVEEELEIGGLELDVVKEYPSLENLTITPTSEQQTFSHPNSYGYDEVVVKGLNVEQLEIMPTNEEQIYTGFYDNVKVAGEPNLSPMNIKKDVDIFGITGILGGEIEEKDIIFIDYDGTILYSYTLEEMRNLESLPPLPSHEGLTCQGWNWTLEEIKDYNNPNVIGATYITDDGKTRIYIDVPDDNFSLNCGFGLYQGSAIIDWGDGNQEEIDGKTSVSTYFYPHTYKKKGSYVITIEVIGATLSINGSGNVSYLISTLNGSASQLHCSLISKIELGNNVSLSTANFGNLTSLLTITIPETVKDISKLNLTKNYKLKSLTLPRGTTNITTTRLSQQNYNIDFISVPPTFALFSRLLGNMGIKRFSIPKGATIIPQEFFGSCVRLKQLIIPEGITAIGQQGMSGLESLYKIEFPSTISDIQTYAFMSSKILIYDFSKCTSVPVISGSQPFNSTPSTKIFIVPDELYDEWIVATNWVAYASGIVKKSEWS